MLFFVRVFLGSLLVILAQYSFAVTYYVSMNGNDANAGTSPGAAWRSILRVNQGQFLPGDQILFEAGRTFEGSLYLDAASGGVASNPVVIGSYGSGMATIFSTGTGLFVYNTGGVTIKDLIFQGNGIGVNTQDGIVFYNTLTKNTKLPGITIQNLRVSGFGRSGILLYGEGADASKSGYRDVLIEQVEVFNNADNGLIVGGNYTQNTSGYHHENVVIRLVKAYQNPGIANKGGHSGSGILLGNTQNGLIEYCHAWGNGINNNFSGGGPVGIWSWDADQITIQYNEANHNRTKSMDGGGFDLDGGVTNSVLQYNYSHNNDGPGYLVAQFSNANVMENNIIRYNISQNDGRRRAVGGIHFWSANNAKPVRNIAVYGNTILVDKNYNSNIAAIRVSAGNFTGLDFINNILMTRNKAFSVHISGNTGTRFLGNAYWEASGSYAYWYHGSTYASLNNWRSAKGVERWNNNAVGFQGNPQLNSPGNGKTIGNPANMHNLIPEYQLKSNSPLMESGLPVATITGKPDGGMDFYRQPLPGNGKRSVGAHQSPSQAPPVVNYALTVAVTGQGSVSRSPNQASYAAGTTVSLTPQAASGWQFSHWTGAASGSSMPLSVVMDAQKAITAVFTEAAGAAKPVLLGATAIDPVTNQELGPLTEGRVFNRAQLSNGQLTARAEPGAMVESVFFELTGPVRHTRTESVAPFALHGDSNGNYSGASFPVGNYTLRMTPYEKSNRGGIVGDPLIINFSVQDSPGPAPAPTFTLTTQINGQGSISVSPSKSSYAQGETVSLTAVPASGWAFSGWSGNAAGTTNPVTLTMDANKSVTAQFTSTSTSTAQSVTRFTLINPATELEVGTLSNGQVIDVSQFPQQQINVRAYTAPDPVGSVVFRAQGPTNVNRTETAAPYALFGDRDGIDYFGGNLSPGSYTLTATPYTLAGGKGTVGTPLTISFTVVNGANARMAAAPEETAIQQLAAEIPSEKWQVYPNPFTDQLWIEMGQAGKMEWQLFQQTGALLFKGSQEQTQLLDIRYGQLPLGFYWLHVISGEGEKRVFKLLKQ